MKTQKLLKLRKARRKETLRRYVDNVRLQHRGYLTPAQNYILYMLRGRGQHYQYFLRVW